MRYEEILSVVSQNIRKTSVKNIDRNMAVEFNIIGEGEGAFYIEIKDGTAFVEPYEYYDRDAKIIVSAETLLKIVKNEKTPEESFADGNLIIEGNIDVAYEILTVFKATAKKTVAKKNIVKKAVKAEKEIVEKTKRKNSKIAKDIEK